MYLSGVIANGTDRLKIVEKCVPLDDVLRHIEASPRTDVQTAALALLNAFFIKSNKLPVMKDREFICMMVKRDVSLCRSKVAALTNTL